MDTVEGVERVTGICCAAAATLLDNPGPQAAGFHCGAAYEILSSKVFCNLKVEILPAMNPFFLVHCQ